MTLLGSVFNDILVVSIVGGFALFVIAKFRQQTVKELTDDLKEMFKPKIGEE